jgi:hypothetical protein
MINVDTNAEAVKKLLEDVRKDQLPFARSLIANRMAQVIKKNETEVMKSRLDRPKAFTLNSLMLKPGNKHKPEARVWFKDFAPKGTPAGKYLMPQVYGGDRPLKRSEKALMAMGYLRKGKYLAPASGAKRDAYGNMSRGQTVQVLSALRAFSGVGANQNASGSDRSKKAQAKSGADKFFWSTINGETGVWQRQRTAFGTGAKAILLEQDAPKYRVKFPFFKVAENTTTANYAKVAKRAIDEAMTTARPQ